MGEDGGQPSALPSLTRRPPPLRLRLRNPLQLGPGSLRTHDLGTPGWHGAAIEGRRELERNARRHSDFREGLGRRARAAATAATPSTRLRAGVPEPTTSSATSAQGTLPLHPDTTQSQIHRHHRHFIGTTGLLCSGNAKTLSQKNRLSIVMAARGPFLSSLSLLPPLSSLSLALVQTRPKPSQPLNLLYDRTPLNVTNVNYLLYSNFGVVTRLERGREWERPPPANTDQPQKVCDSLNRRAPHSRRRPRNTTKKDSGLHRGS